MATQDERARRRERVRLQCLVPSDVSLVVCGHSHRRGVAQLGRLTVVNAGTLHYADAPGFAVMDLAEKSVQFYDIDDGQVIEAERLVIQ